MQALLNKPEKARLRGLLMALPLLGSVDALGLAIIIAIFLHVVGIGEIGRFTELVRWLSAELGAGLTDRIVGLTLLIGIALARFFTGVFTQYLIYRFCYSVQTRLSSSFLASFLGADLDYIVRKDKTFGVQIVFSECSRFSSGILLNALQIAYEALTLLIYLAILLYTNVMLSLFFILATGLTYLLIRFGSGKLTRRLGNRRLRLDAKRLSVVNESFQGFQEVGCYGLGAGFIEKYERATSESLRATLHQQLLNLLPKNVFEILMVAGLIGVAFYTRGPMPPELMATMAILLGAAFRCMPSINRILASRQMISFEMPVVTELTSLWNESEKVQRTSTAPPPQSWRGQATVRVPAVRFSRSAHSGTFQLNVDPLVLAPDDLVLIMGDSGSGKSTYLGCVAGLLSEGREVLREGDSAPRVSYAPQASFMLNDTLEANITLAAFFPGKPVDQQRLREAMRVAQLLDPLTGTPMIPSDTVLDGSGSVISGGQRQRIALARALYFESDLLILDEITSGLDEPTEQKFIDCYRASTLRRPTLFVTHRSHLAASATRVCRLQNGVLN
jgi:ATP-binding cassette, subfamily B, bacterial PglK